VQQFVNLLEQFGQWWVYGAAAIGAVASCYGAWIVFRSRILFIVRAADVVRRVYGDDAESVVQFWYVRQKTIAIQEVRQRLLESSVGLSIYVCDKEGNCEFVNDELCDLFGLEKADCIGFGWLSGLGPNDRQRVHDNWMFCVKNKIPYDCDYKVQNQRTKEIHTVTAKGYPVVSHSGEVLCYVGTITEH
jgi:PAS domain S-box-containing protein